MKARSRLKSAEPIKPNFYADTIAPVVDVRETKIKPSSHRSSKSKVSIAWPSWIAHFLSWIPWHEYLSHLLTLIFGVISYVVVLYLVTHTDPTRFANFGLPHLYLPFQIAFFIGNLFLFSFLSLKTRRGLLVATWLQILVFLKLQLVIVTWQLALGLLIVFVIIEGLSTWFERRSAPTHANLHQTSFHRPRRTYS